MPEASFRFMAELVGEYLPRNHPVRALHIGNFVGLSLCYLSWLVRDRHPCSVVVSIDPNTPHRGIEGPQKHVFALLHRFGLLDTNLVIPGYSVNRTGGERQAASEDDVAREFGCENVLSSLARLCGPRFDLVVIDGNHEESYLAQEVAALRDVLADGGLLVFDDISEWQGVTRVFEDVLRDGGFVRVGDDGRVGVIQARPASGWEVADRE